jgi:hypothetical protein
VTGVLVHELFHLNDYSTDMGLESSLVRPALGAALQSLPAEEVDRFSVELNYVDLRLLEDLSSKDAGSIADISATLRKHGNPHLASFVERNGMSVFRQALEESGLLDEHDHIRTEEAATRYTDQFMKKHFGDAEPQRGRYDNAGSDPTPGNAQPTVPQPLAHPAIVSGFTEDYAVAVPPGTPALPTVLPTNLEATPSPPAHPFAHLLMGVSLNLQDVTHTPLSANPDRVSAGAVAALPNPAVDRGAAATPIR